MKHTTINTSGMLADRLRVMRKTEALSFCAGSLEPKTKEAESSPASLDRHFRYKVSTEVFFLCGTKIKIFLKKNTILFGFNHSIYVHWLADVHSGGFAPAFTLSFHDSECSRKPPMPIASVVMGQCKKQEDKVLRMKSL